MNYGAGAGRRGPYYFTLVTNFTWERGKGAAAGGAGGSRREGIGRRREREWTSDRCEGIEREEGHGGRDGGKREWRRGEDTGNSGSASVQPRRKYGKRLASFSRIRFELLSSRRALSIVAENYFIIARSVGLERSPEGAQGSGTRPGEGGRGTGEGWRGGTTVQPPRFRDLLISRKKTRGPSKNAAATAVGRKMEKYRTEVMPSPRATPVITGPSARAASRSLVFTIPVTICCGIDGCGVATRSESASGEHCNRCAR